MYTIISSASSNTFTFSSTILKRYGEYEEPCFSRTALFPFIQFDVGYWLTVYCLHCFGMSLVTRLLSLRGSRFLSKLIFNSQWNNDVAFFVQFVYIDVFVVVVVELSLHVWEEDYLIMANDISDVFLNSIFRYFTEYICIDVHEEKLSAILFLSWIFVWFKYQGWQCTQKMNLAKFLLFWVWD